ncbi:MAG TPA: DNA topoisomerase, partial [Miltoncostaeaceae bacterium]|nr:DNA topoisomerase [Miltoncostaeaceae bacterium]
SGDMAGQLKGVARGVGAAAPEYADAARYVLGLDRLPLGRVVNDARVTDHHAIIPTEGEHDLSGLSRDERRIYDMVARRFLAVFHPPARLERTVVETRVGEHLFRSRGKVLLEPGWRAAYGQEADPAPGSQKGDEEKEQALPPLAVGQRVRCAEAEALAKQTKPPARYSEGTLLRAMETAGKLVDDDEAAEAMKDAGIGTPATRAATIERLVDAGYVEREGRSLRATEKGLGLLKMLGDHLLTRPELTGRWEQRLNRIERGEERAEDFRREIDGFTREVVAWFGDKERGDLRIEREPLAPCPTPGCEGQIVEYPKSYGCNTYHGKDDPGCGYTLWKQQNGHALTREEALEHIAAGRSSKDLESRREVIGPCPTPGCGGEIVERTKSFGCTSWKSRSEPGCGYVIWKKVRGQKGEVDAETARGMVARGETNAAPAASKEPLGDCPTPGCGGQIVENSRAYGCTSWKSRKNPGCGFVIWKREKGHDVTRERAAARLEEARTGAPKVAAPTG